MGCELGKLATTPKPQNQTSATDPRLPLTAKQKFIVMASWKAVSRELEATGVFMLIRLFEENEELIQMFSRFLDLKSKEEPYDMVELGKHAEKVMTALDEGIKGLDDMDVVLTCLHQVGATHTKIPGFNPQYFWKIEQPFLQAVKRTLDDRYSDNVESIYKITIKFIIETLIDGFDKAQSQNDKAQSADTAKS
ncbi:globin-1-like [Ceratina calcarata]|uniref:Globin-1-like n=1 Tax=Ceratina calcarata TaxID=156304 RepID=A0AAJ7WAT7_9HYME|nr:globin-1-like [Ceratina calcarata]XP_017878758.1 globin-1-like [Ceratina calcarata]XP_026668691.1 globin-1-like [Ceratina calcarata]XP_026668692.1 globin-1-like [Ceratina calcarata]XP_026668693.1 globin-1-like [Ceratina calcarata]XP_026668694.1 globin-1-like [Ceratina calcarata]